MSDIALSYYNVAMEKGTNHYSFTMADHFLFFIMQLFPMSGPRFFSKWETLWSPAASSLETLLDGKNNAQYIIVTSHWSGKPFPLLCD